jgi:GTP-binding protein HflX
LSDTVGFIRDLPHKLVEAFEATLQEAADADLLLHVVDAASPLLAEQMTEVQRVLEEIGAGKVPQIFIYNKFDKLEETQQPRILVDVLETDGGVRVPRVFVSALTGHGIGELRRLLSQAVAGSPPELLHISDTASDSETVDNAVPDVDRDSQHPLHSSR